MIELVGWLLLTLAVAAALHFAAIWYIPRLVVRLVARNARKAGTAINTFGYGGVRSAPVSRTLIPAINPDLAIAFGVYDVSQGPVRVRCHTPPSDTYWSVSLYASNTDNILLINDKAAKAPSFDLVIVGRKSKYRQQGNEEVVISPTRRGVAIVRILVEDREDEEALGTIDQILRKTVMSSDQRTC
jgi:uncharacterized membrane protein